MLKILFIIFAGIGVLGLAFIFYMIVSFMSIGKVSEVKVKLESKNRIFVTGVSLEEVERIEPPLEYEYLPKAGNLPISQDILTNEDLSFVFGSASFDNDVERQYLYLESPDYSFAFKEDVLYSVVSDKLGEKDKRWSDLGIKMVRHAAYIHSELMLVFGDNASLEYFPTNIYLINPYTFDNKIIASDPYYSFARPPKVIQLDNFNGIVLIYYIGSYSYAYGGDSSRPKKSIVRVFNEQYVTGIDVVEMSFASGTIVDVYFENNSLILTGDPSRPSQSGQERLSPRFWKVDLTALIL